MSLLRKLLWFDCSAAGAVGTLMLALNAILAPFLGLPRALILFMGVMNLAYGAFSFSLARRQATHPGRTKALVVANFTWAFLCAAAAIHLAGPSSWLGAAYIATEGVVVGTLAAVELRALRAAMAAI